LVSIVVGCDPNLTGKDAHFGIVVVGRGQSNDLYCLADRSVPESGRSAALAVWRACAEFRADFVLYEENLGKRFLKEVLEDAYKECVEQGLFPKHTSPPMESVHAKHGKKTRAEPVAMRSQQGRFHMVGYHDELEKEMVRFDPSSTQESPDRMDAMVHACLKLMTGERKRMRVGNAYDYDFQLSQDLYNLDSLGM
jgi:phage terminase large subunit-like protein